MENGARVLALISSAYCFYISFSNSGIFSLRFLTIQAALLTNIAIILGFYN